jgi:hypothetical protein
MEAQIMKKYLKLLFITSAIFLVSVTITNAQIGGLNLSVEVKENQIQKNDEANPCLTAREYELIENRCAENVRMLNINKSKQKKLLSKIANEDFKSDFWYSFFL